MILIVEDEPAARMLAADILEEAGYPTCEAPDAETALAVLERRDDITHVFTDVSMPGRSGLELARDIGERWPDTRVIVTSAYLAAADAAPVAVRFVPKPWTTIDILNVVV